MSAESSIKRGVSMEIVTIFLSHLAGSCWPLAEVRKGEKVGRFILSQPAIADIWE